MIGKKLDDIKESDLKMLVDDRVREGKTIEYKTSLNLKNEKNKLEFLKNVSSFANASGGDLIYGIKEGSGENKGIGCGNNLVHAGTSDRRSKQARLAWKPLFS